MKHIFRHLIFPILLIAFLSVSSLAFAAENLDSLFSLATNEMTDEQQISYSSSLWKEFVQAPSDFTHALAQKDQSIVNKVLHVMELGLSNGGLDHRQLLSCGYSCTSSELTEAEKNVVYDILLLIEMNCPADILAAVPVDHQTTFEKTRYADGAYSELCGIQLATLFQENPAAFIKELAKTDRDTTLLVSPKLIFEFSGSGLKKYHASLQEISHTTLSEAEKDCLTLLLAECEAKLEAVSEPETAPDTETESIPSDTTPNTKEPFAVSDPPPVPMYLIGVLIALLIVLAAILWKRKH